MKKEYSKPELDAKAFAQFENVFTRCTKGPNKADCYEVSGWPPGGGPDFAAFKSNAST